MTQSQNVMPIGFLSKSQVVKNTLYHAFVHADFSRDLVGCATGKP
jgi:hypothetical protein